MSSKHLKVRSATEIVYRYPSRVAANYIAVIARNALAQEESEEFSGDFGDPINIHIENDRDGCAC